jgi:hypothetical protein
LTSLIHLMWKVDPDGSLPSICTEVCMQYKGLILPVDDILLTNVPLGCKSFL